MTALNRYIDNQHAYIKKKKQQPLTGFTNQKGEQATWGDIAVTFTNEAGVTANFLFNNGYQPNARITSKFNNADRLDAHTHQLLFAYLLDVFKENVSINHKRIKLTSARKFLVKLGCNVASTSLSDIHCAIDSMVYTHGLSSFFDWLHQHKMLAASCSPDFPVGEIGMRGKSGDDAIEAEKNNLPDDKALLVLGAIFHDVIPPYKGEPSDISAWQDLIHPSKKQLDAFTCTMSALAMSSPNRAAAEQVLLTKQRLQSHLETVDGKQETVYYLNWRGSKGYLDNQKHFNVEMAESLDRALHYTSIVTEPARVLARFYRDPTQSLKIVLGEFKPSIENITSLNPAMDKPISLIHLALLLGFYDGTDKVARVTDDTQGAIEAPNRNKGLPRYLKPIAELSPIDKLAMVHQCRYGSILLGQALFSTRQYEKYCAGKKVLTVAELQNHFVNANQASLTGYNTKQTKQVDYENALFTFTEKQLNAKKASHFLLTPIGSLEQFVSSSLKKFKGKDQKTIFERHGFSSDFFIKPHQFRHWQNDYLAKKGLPHLLISMLSGRKSVEQTLSYIHTTDAQNASVISDILYNQEAEAEVEEHVGKRIQSKTQYDAAIENLNPTFVTEVGFCVQNLTLSPCTYMTEFETQCTLCPSSCHIAHDEDAIELLKKDLKVQMHNLEQVQNTINFTTSDGMQQWYSTHYRNTCLLKNLIEVLSDKTIKQGSIVRFLTSLNTVRITDLDTKTVTQRELNLPSPDEALLAAIEAKTKPDNTSAKKNFLGFLGSV
ncbi:hypothetical protein [Endozoicomonas euniceicola]|uniref:Integrase n=1 Tax=Endozoicomonas euniceicola TaxID=1234143 RepID=A0ABY6GPD3_9GAMM|nr:hypothetical protein [Endozoicomonas euniceicola]UYM14600.1 hypothetical protein NX720_17105 [Endozoicomonas euniceicola]